MKKSHKSHTPKKSHKRKGRKGKKRGLGSTSGRAKGMVAGLKETGIVLGGNLGGLVLGALITKGIDKVPFLASSPEDGKVKAILKKAVKPVVLIGLGTTVRHFSYKAGKGATFVKGIGDGLNVIGLFTGAKAIFSKSEMFNGLMGGIGLGDAGASKDQIAEYYRENADALKKIAQENAIHGTENELEELGLGVDIPGTKLQLTDMSMVL